MVPLPVGSTGTKKHAYVSDPGFTNACALQEEPGGFYCALPREDSIHDTGQTALEKVAANVNAMFAPYVQHRAEPIRFPDHPTVQDVHTYFEECTDLVRSKNPKYGEAWKRQGYMGNLARIMSKASRLQSMLWRDAEDGPPVPESDVTESIEDTLRDLANLTAFMTLNYTEGNRWGA